MGKQIYISDKEVKIGQGPQNPTENSIIIQNDDVIRGLSGEGYHGYPKNSAIISVPPYVNISREQAPKGCALYRNALYFNSSNNNDFAMVHFFTQKTNDLNSENDPEGGHLDLITGDNMDEPIRAIQMKKYSSVDGEMRTAYILDAQGNTTFPGTLKIGNTTPTGTGKLMVGPCSINCETGVLKIDKPIESIKCRVSLSDVAKAKLYHIAKLLNGTGHTRVMYTVGWNGNATPLVIDVYTNSQWESKSEQNIVQGGKAVVQDLTHTITAANTSLLNILKGIQFIICPIKKSDGIIENHLFMIDVDSTHQYIRLYVECHGDCIAYNSITVEKEKTAAQKWYIPSKSQPSEKRYVSVFFESINIDKTEYHLYGMEKNPSALYLSNIKSNFFGLLKKSTTPKNFFSANGSNGNYNDAEYSTIINSVHVPIIVNNALVAKFSFRTANSGTIKPNIYLNSTGTSIGQITATKGKCVFKNPTGMGPENLTISAYTTPYEESCDFAYASIWCTKDKITITTSDDETFNEAYVYVSLYINMYS